MDGRTDPPGPTEGSLGKDIQASLGRILVDHYQKIVKEGVPDRFANLLLRYEQKVQDTAGQNSANVPKVAKSTDNEDKDPAA